jgi:hypothetical protein
VAQLSDRPPLYVVGDPHGQWQPLARLLAALPPEATVFILGDVGLWIGDVGRDLGLGRQVWYLRGNHDYQPLYESVYGVTQMARDVWYVPDGVHVMAGLRVAVLGGADTPAWADKAPYWTWWPTEGARAAGAEQILRQVRRDGPVDVLLTHAPTRETVWEMIQSPADPDASCRLVSGLWDALDRPPLYSGHMHRRWQSEDGLQTVVPELWAWRVDLSEPHG